MERPEAAKGLSAWKWWIARWNIFEAIPFIAGCIGYAVGVIIAGFIAGYKAGESWVRTL